eukprot:CAMPEP_0206430758 /NCGR_PEP_ID=MMETSP0324_2-20121206/6993_1 /ASSEMBLY_ACC=CAM_ASM_000836 /TAXON_ID=2866 /ORGANISM="Crypthecodinium cohnii, Strain Seligo" /LENGTH=58 /DNA_ID=CAMNT_0053896623 /DNA_START=83 /DNA_END=256 /DNA_ORIENTATION=+
MHVQPERLKGRLRRGHAKASANLRRPENIGSEGRAHAVCNSDVVLPVVMCMVSATASG